MSLPEAMRCFLQKQPHPDPPLAGEGATNSKCRDRNPNTSTQLGEVGGVNVCSGGFVAANNLSAMAVRVKQIDFDTISTCTARSWRAYFPWANAYGYSMSPF